MSTDSPFQRRAGGKRTSEPRKSPQRPSFRPLTHLQVFGRFSGFYMVGPVKKIQINPFIKLPCGTVIGPDGSDRFGNQKAAFQCSKCFGLGSSVYYKMRLPDGAPSRPESCGCIKKGNSKRYHDDQVRTMTSASRKFALSTLHRTRNPLLTGEICGIAKHTVAVLLRFEYARLSRRFSAWKMAIIHTMACINKITAMHKYKLTEAELHLVVTMHSQNVRASRKAAQAEAERVMLAAAVAPDAEAVAYESGLADAQFECRAAWEGLSERDRMDIMELLSHAKSQMESAIEFAKRTLRGPRQGELTPVQYVNSERYSELKWNYDAAIRVPRDVARELFGDLLAKFIELVRSTQRCRDERRRTMLDRIGNGFKPVRQVVVAAKRGVVWSPSQSTEQVVEMMSTRARYQFVMPAAA